MFTMTATVCIEAPVAEVWRRLARIEEVALWGVRHSIGDGDVRARTPNAGP